MISLATGGPMNPTQHDADAQLAEARAYARRVGRHASPSAMVDRVVGRLARGGGRESPPAPDRRSASADNGGTGSHGGRHRREQRRSQRADNVEPSIPGGIVTAVIAVMCAVMAIANPQLWWLVFIALGLGTNAARMFGRAARNRQGDVEPPAEERERIDVAQPTAADTRAPEPPVPVVPPIAAEPLDPRVARIQSLCDRLLAELESGPPIVREVVTEPKATIGGLRQACIGIARRERELRSVLAAQEEGAPAAERAAFAARVSTERDESSGTVLARRFVRSTGRSRSAPSWRRPPRASRRRTLASSTPWRTCTCNCCALAAPTWARRNSAGSCATACGTSGPKSMRLPRRWSGRAHRSAAGGERRSSRRRFGRRRQQTRRRLNGKPPPCGRPRRRRPAVADGQSGIQRRAAFRKARLEGFGGSAAGADAGSETTTWLWPARSSTWTSTLVRFALPNGISTISRPPGSSQCVTNRRICSPPESVSRRTRDRRTRWDPALVIVVCEIIWPAAPPADSSSGFGRLSVRHSTRGARDNIWVREAVSTISLVAAARS